MSQVAEVSQAHPDTSPEMLSLQVVAPENGYVQTYLSNESQADINVYFDDLQVVHRGSNILSVTDYYPFGAPFQQPSVGLKGKYLYQGKEWQTELGLNLYDFHARQYDPYLGRWHVQDPQQQFASPYLAMGNNPISYVDPDGELAFIAVALVVAKAAAIGAGVSAASYSLSTAASGQSWDWGQFGNAVAIGAASGVLSAGTGALASSAMQGINGIVPGALVKGSIQGIGGGLGGGITAELTGGSFDQGFGQGFITGFAMGAVSGGIDGYQNAISSHYDRNVWFGNLSQEGREAFVKDLTLKYDLYQNGMMRLNFEKLDNAYGVTRPIEPGTGNTIGVAEAAKNHPNGVNSEFAFDSRKVLSMKKIEANIIHEKQHMVDLYTGKASRLYRSIKPFKAFQATMEIRAHQTVLDYGIQKSYNLQRINYWSQFIP